MGCYESREDRFNRKFEELENCYESREDRFNREFKELMVTMEKSGFSMEEYGDVFTKLFKTYAGTVLMEKGAKICQTPSDFERISEALKPYFDEIYSLHEGSHSFIDVMFNKVEDGRITSIEQLIDIAKKLSEINKVNSDINGQPVKKEGGCQFYKYIEVVMARSEVEEVLPTKPIV